ncbi:hypothetical protein GT347_13595 [Xylophilus rhododendri]|uniref:Cellulose biosynthesis protein BcsR n=1 Tax=Xylophilus rhododendri TaxID=2697032 RepID=A0A857J774_9BURK|nr:cellulose biosynthesis protein BcsP [Xylophilus rhododendri]QHI98929.1 hypothetical protein GT347_13595 [Xylophilus rhododendri]
MSSDDIANLYRQFGGQSDSYQELGRDNVVRQSRERWPLLANVRQQERARAASPVSSSSAPTEAQAQGGPLPVFDEAAAAAAAEEARRRPPVARPRAPAQNPVAAPIEPVLQAAPVEPAPLPLPVPAASLPPAGAPLPPATSPVAGTELQGMFARLARAPEPKAAPADRELSLLRRLLKP